MNKAWIRAIARAEDSFWTIVFSARKRIGERGVLLPERFNSKVKIKRYLQKSMSACLAERVIRNLQLRRIGGRLAIPVGDGIGAPPILKKKLLSHAKGRVTIAVWFGFDKDDRLFRVSIAPKRKGTMDCLRTPSIGLSVQPIFSKGIDGLLLCLYQLRVNERQRSSCTRKRNLPVSG